MTEPPAIEKLFPELASFSAGDFARIGTARPTLMIAMTARTGSSHLCSGLSSVLPVGDPIELFNARSTLIWEKKVSGAATYAELLARRFAGSPGTIVFKTSWIDFAYFRDNIFRMFPNLKIVYLNRLDIEAQAVSLFKAVVTGKWHDSPQFDNSPALPPKELAEKFNLVRICTMIGAINREKAAWEAFFFEHGSQPLRINYEDLTGDFRRAVEIIASHIGHAGADLSNLRSDFSALSDSINDDWLKRVRKYRNGDFYRRHRTLMQKW